MKATPCSAMRRSRPVVIAGLRDGVATLAVLLISFAATAAFGDSLLTATNAPASRGFLFFSAQKKSESGRGRVVQLVASDAPEGSAVYFAFPEREKVTASFRLLAKATDKGSLEIGLLSPTGSVPPVRLSLAENGKIKAVHGKKTVQLRAYPANQWLAFEIEADATRGRYTVRLNDRTLLRNAMFAERAASLQRLEFRARRRSPISGQTKTSGAPPAAYLIEQVKTAR